MDNKMDGNQYQGDHNYGNVDEQKENDKEEVDMFKNYQIDLKTLEKFIKPSNLIVPNENKFKSDINISPNLLKPRALRISETKRFNDN